MADRTQIEWTDATWNPVRGCTRVSDGCRFCYAERVAARFSGEGMPYEGLAKMTSSGPSWTGKVALVPEQLAQAARWKKPRRIFVNSMSDLFHAALAHDQIMAVFGAMAAAPQHTFQVLTKRSARMWAWVRSAGEEFAASGRFNVPAMIEHAACVAQQGGDQEGADVLFRAANARAGVSEWPLKNVHLGVSVENQHAADERVPHLLATPAASRFLSCEPLLGAVDLDLVGDPDVSRSTWDDHEEGISWVIVGGESGPNARPMHPEWARSLRDQCAEAGVPFFFKQWGEWAPGFDVETVEYGAPSLAKNERWLDVEGGSRLDRDHTWLMRRVGKKAAGRLLDGVTHDAFPDEKDAKKALERIRQNREWEVLRATNQEREACARVADRANRLDIAEAIRARGKS